MNINFFMKNNLIRDIEQSLITHGQPEVPGIQTWPILFENTSEHWENIKSAFVDALHKKPDYIRAWAYIQRPGVEDAEYPGWHIHRRNREYGYCFECGVMYLDKFKTGTMFKRGDEEICGDPTPFVWHMFSPDDVHSPPIWDIKSKLTRYTIAAEAIEIKKCE
jgi:hypothetical protein